MSLIFIVAGCQDVQRPQPPENLLPKDKLIEILADAYIGNASRSKSVNNRVLRSKGVQIDSIIYSKHQVDSLSFAESNAYYGSNLELYTEIMTEVEKILVAKKAIIDSVMAEETAAKKEKDSLASMAKEKPVVEEGLLQESAQDEEEE